MERKRTKTQEQLYVQALATLRRGEAWLRDDKLKGRTVPPEWRKIADTPPVPKKARVTASFDADLVRWFRSFGQGYQTQMNRVLRAYMLLVVSKEIEGPYDCDWKGDPI